MFCPECGTSNPDNAVYCEKCGNKLETAPVKTAGQAPKKPKEPKQPRKPMPLAIKLVIILAAVLIVVGVGGFFVLKSMTNPENIVEKYAKAYVAQDSKEVFACLGLTESPFVNAERLDKALKTDDGMHYEDSKEYTIEPSVSNKTSENELVYRIKFTDSNNAFSYTAKITLTKKSTKKFLVFDDWKIQTDAFLTKDYGITAPKGAEVTVDDVKLTEKTTSDTDEDKDTYVIPYMLTGEHVAKVKVENFDEFEKKFSTESEDYEKNPVSSVDVSELTLSQEVSDRLTEEATTLLKDVYAGAMAKKSFDKIVSSEDVEEGKFDEMKLDYDELAKNYTSSGTHLKSVEFKQITGETEKSVDYYDEHLAVRVALSAEYTAKSVVKSFWSNKKENKTYDSSTTIYVTYHYVDGKWLLNNNGVVDYCISYTRY